MKQESVLVQKEAPAYAPGFKAFLLDKP